MRTSLAAALLVLVGSSAPAADVSFTTKPTAKKVGRKVKITFAVSAPTDVEVSIVNADGGIVRHLAAGVLGENAPAPLARGKLAQALEWDRTDDLGRPAPPGKCRVRVRAGLKAAYAGTAFSEQSGPANITNVIGLAAGPDGRVRVLTNRWHSGHWNATSVHVFRRNGDYEKTVKPYPANLPVERLQGGVGALKDARGRVMPVIHRVVSMTLYPYEDLSQQMAVTADGNLHLVVGIARYDPPPEQRLATIDADGGVPYESYAGEVLMGRSPAGRLYLAPASDGKAVYATGLNPRDSGFNVRRINPPAVYRIGLPKRDKPELFFGNVSTWGDDEEHLNDPRGIATDGRGRLFICDHASNRIVVVTEKDRKFAGSIKVDSPLWVGAHHKTGAVYVHSGASLVKFSGFKQAKELARLPLPAIPERERARTRWSFALDPAAEPAVLWIGRDRGTNALLRYVEKDNKFGPPKAAHYRPSRRYWNVAVGQQREEVTCKVGWRTLRILNERTGKWRDLSLSGSGGQTYRLGPNGQIYGMDHSGGGIRRWDSKGNYLPFPATVKDKGLKGRLPSRPSGTTSWERDFCVDRAGNIYTKHRGKFYHGRMRVDVYDPDGKLLRTAIWVVSDGGIGPRVDLAGNIYIADAVKPVGKKYPDRFVDRLPNVGGVMLQYAWMYGSVIKFGPKGGAIWFPVKIKQDAYSFDGEPKLDPSLPREKVAGLRNGRVIREPGELQGALWWRFGCAYVLDMHISHNKRCHCTATEFDIDDYGRVFYPDQGRFCVVVLDTNGNEITTFGRYGNQDDCGPDGYVPDAKENCLRPRRGDDPAKLTSPFNQPGIPIAWIVGLGVSDTRAYIADALSRRVTVARFDYAASEQCPAP